MKKAIIALSIFFVVIIASAGITIVSITADATLSEDKLSDKYRDVMVIDIFDNEISGNGEAYVEYNDLPAGLINAFVAVEDKRFFRHGGLDYARIIGATGSNIKSRTFSEGASTITCQLIKNTHLSSDKTFTRKLKEAKLALEVERKYSKEDIITMYLNAIYFGNSIYGVGRAARAFFDKDVKSLSLEESASLAAVVANPSKYSPIINYESNKSRRNVVLRLMFEQGYIDRTTYDTSCAKDIFITGNTKAHPGQSYKQNAIYEASRLLNVGELNIRDSGAVIYTYMNPSKQDILHSALTNSDLLIANKQGALPDAAGILADNISGGISAYYSSAHNLVD